MRTSKLSGVAVYDAEQLLVVLLAMKLACGNTLCNI